MSDRDAVAVRHDAFVAAFNARDIPAMTDCLTEDHVGMPPGRPQQEGRAAAQRFWHEGFAAAESSFSTTSREIAVIGDVAVDHFTFDMLIRPDGGASVRDSGKCVWLWRRDPDGVWRVRLAIWNSDLPVPALWSGG